MFRGRVRLCTGLVCGRVRRRAELARLRVRRRAGQHDMPSRIMNSITCKEQLEIMDIINSGYLNIINSGYLTKWNEVERNAMKWNEDSNYMKATAR